VSFDYRPVLDENGYDFPFFRHRGFDVPQRREPKKRVCPNPKRCVECGEALVNDVLHVGLRTGRPFQAVS
jgi:hypothetical protein